MPKIKCICGNVIGLSEIPSPNQLLIISDEDFDGIYSECINPDKLYEKFNIVAKCKVCGRLHVFWDGFDKAPTIYKPE
jgi:hypothetical protein